MTPSPRTDEPVVCVHQLRVAVPGRPCLLSGLDLQVAEGSRIAIMGPSGSGKSTLLAALGGLLKPTAGRVVSRASQPGDVLWLSQHTLVIPYRSVVDNVALASMTAGRTWRESLELAMAACEVVGLGSVAKTRARAVSGGERQRIGVARAVVGDYRLVLADEPTASLDAALVTQVSETLTTMIPAKTAVITATHDSRVASMHATCLFLAAGALGTIAV